jgi:hypothetical protein
MLPIKQPQLPITSQMTCSTFLLRQPSTFLIGHNLDAPYRVPGVIVRNPRNIHKTSISFFELVSGHKPSNPPLTWTATYGSITFNPMGCEFPDGGINEVGLYVQEMTLLGTRFPNNPDRPQMFMAQWIQYLLDTCESVAAVLARMDRVILDGWEWHFFVADRTGRSAAIDFFDGQPHTYTDTTQPQPPNPASDCVKIGQWPLAYVGRMWYHGRLPVMFTRMRVVCHTSRAPRATRSCSFPHRSTSISPMTILPALLMPLSISSSSRPRLYPCGRLAVRSSSLPSW